MKGSPKLKCSRVRACGWQGTEGELIFPKAIKRGVMSFQPATCPKCGGNDFRNVKEEKL